MVEAYIIGIQLIFRINGAFNLKFYRYLKINLS